MTIREASKADIPAIQRIWNQAIRETSATFTTLEKSEDDLRNLLKSQPVLVADTSSGPAGFATFGPFRSGPGYTGAVEHSIYLDPSQTGQGIGRYLLTALESRAQTEEVRVMIAGISGENGAAIRFHAALGYTETARMAGVGQKFGRLHDLIFMQKNLTVAD